MSCILLLGALKKGTSEYVYPAIANREDDHICPDCKRDLILRKGEIRVHHFAHCKSDNPCTYYSRPSEAQIHKDAKMLLKTLLDNKTPLKIITNCDPSCPDRKTEYEIPEITETSRIIVEYGFDYKGRKVADVAYLDENEIVCIFEIYNTHLTNPENRPEPWFELDATKFINAVNNGEEIRCIRKRSCEKCELVACSSGADNCRNVSGKCPKWVWELNSGYCTECHLNSPEAQRLREIERKEARRLEVIRWNEAQRLLEIKLKEEQRLKERNKELAELKWKKSAEVIKQLRAEHKRCAKCKSYERCKKCSDKIWATHNKIIEEFMNSCQDSTNEIQS